MDENKLPELPEPPILGTSRYGSVFRGFTADQMQAYALAAQAPLIERIAELERRNDDLLVHYHMAQQEAVQLERLNAELRSALEEITEVAERVDSWESFPSGPIEKAWAALAATNQEQSK